MRRGQRKHTRTDTLYPHSPLFRSSGLPRGDHRALAHPLGDLVAGILPHEAMAPLGLVTAAQADGIAPREAADRQAIEFAAVAAEMHPLRRLALKYRKHATNAVPAVARDRRLLVSAQLATQFARPAIGRAKCRARACQYGCNSV